MKTLLGSAYHINVCYLSERLAELERIDQEPQEREEPEDQDAGQDDGGTEKEQDLNDQEQPEPSHDA